MVIRKVSIGTNGTIGTNRKAHHSNGSITKYALIKGTDYFPCDLAGYRAIPMVHWYQWCDWYQ